METDPQSGDSHDAERAPADQPPADQLVNPQRRRGRWRWLVPLVVVCVWAAAVAVLAAPSSDPEAGSAGLVITLATLLIALFLLFWLVFLSGLRWRTRLLVLVALAVAWWGAAQVIEYRGLTGDAVPIFAWREARELPQFDDAGAAAGAIDLTTTTPHDYPQYLGPQRRGTISDVQLAADWSARPPRLLWRQPIGLGWSSLAVVGPYAVTQEQRGDREYVVCYRVDDGSVAWATAHDDPFGGSLGGPGPRATPTIERGRVYALGARGQLSCLEGATGQIVWSTNVLADNGAPPDDNGQSWSPLVIDGLVVVPAGGTEGRSLVAYDCATGQIVWQAGDDATSYSSPLVATLAGQRQIVIFNKNSIAGHAVDDGRQLFSHAWPTNAINHNMNQPVVIEPDRLLLATEHDRCTALLAVEAGEDREGGDGSKGEGEGDEGGRLSVRELWQNRNLKSSFSNVVVHEGFIYGLDGAILTCLDVATGERRWKQGRYGHGQVLLVGDVLLIQAEGGDLVQVEARPDAHRERGRVAALDSKTWNSPALTWPYLLVRNDRELACYRLDEAEPQHAQ